MPACRHFTTAELSLLSTTPNPQHRLLITVGCNTGFRICELLSLRIKDVFDGNVVLSHVMVSKENMKGSRYSRTIKLNTRTQHEITSFLSGSAYLPDQYLFRSRQGVNKSWSTCQAWRIIRRICRDLHIEGNIGTHSLRKTFAMSIYSATNNNIRLT